MPDVLTCQSSLFSNCFAKLWPICLFSFSSLQGVQINSKFLTPTPQTKQGSGIMHPFILIYKWSSQDITARFSATTMLAYFYPCTFVFFRRKIPERSAERRKIPSIIKCYVKILSPLLRAIKCFKVLIRQTFKIHRFLHNYRNAPNGSWFSKKIFKRWILCLSFSRPQSRHSCIWLLTPIPQFKQGNEIRFPFLSLALWTLQ